jgi:uncharacterized protein with PIN domain
MRKAYFRFYGSLNDFLPPQRKQTRFTYRLKDIASIKDTIEAIGIPHPEVDLLLVNHESVDFSYWVQDEDWVSVYPGFTCLDITPITKVRPPALAEARFVLDIHLGKLATYLRLLGFDTLYRNDYHDQELAAISSQQRRILLTRDRGLLKRSLVTYGYWVRQQKPEAQSLEILHRFELFKQIRPFHRCLRCNSPVQPVAKESICDRLLPKTQQYYDEFCRCQQCDRLYWKGSHYEKMQQFVESVLVLQHDRSYQLDERRSC